MRPARPVRQSRYVDGKLDGTVVSWASDGRVCGTSTLRAGTGALTHYWNDCAVYRSGEMKDGEEIGTWTELDRDGKPLPPAPSPPPASPG